MDGKWKVDPNQPLKLINHDYYNNYIDVFPITDEFNIEDEAAANSSESNSD